MNLKVFPKKKNYETYGNFFEVYSKFNVFQDSEVSRNIWDYLNENRSKMIWTIEDLEEPPLYGVGNKLVELIGTHKVEGFKNPELRRMTGAMIAYILRDNYEPVSSGHRIPWLPFITTSKYRKKYTENK